MSSNLAGSAIHFNDLALGPPLQAKARGHTRRFFERFLGASAAATSLDVTANFNLPCPCFVAVLGEPRAVVVSSRAGALRSASLYSCNASRIALHWQGVPLLVVAPHRIFWRILAPRLQTLNPLTLPFV